MRILPFPRFHDHLTTARPLAPFPVRLPSLCAPVRIAAPPPPCCCRCCRCCCVQWARGGAGEAVQAGVVRWAAGQGLPGRRHRARYSDERVDSPRAGGAWRPSRQAQHSGGGSRAGGEWWWGGRRGGGRRGA
ncbi:unnamed protein product [Closterium sp. NIES-54]